MFCKNRLSAGISGLHSLNTGRSILPTVLAAAALLLLTDSRDAFAGTGGEEFADVWDTLKEWIQGTLGRVICGSSCRSGQTEYQRLGHRYRRRHRSLQYPDSY